MRQIKISGRWCYMLLLLTIPFALSSCHFATSNNGQLDGLWQLTTMENLQTGAVTDGRDQMANWAFQGNLLCFRARTVYPEIFCRFQHAGDVLKVHEPRRSGRHSESPDTLITNASELNIFGMYQTEEYFDILELDGDGMRLQSGNMRLTFRRY